ncbi:MULTISPECIES: SymE family type I addiction module toxin [Pseudoxanthomonas]|uniref:Toxin SymE-like domain-containing protein n=1 Tax=Pseudoxanthomonas winnipegensis TaxID=2480810 RepID=A0AAW8G7S4_9GAMM|nr:MULTISPECIES: SymE family type I addiction module toxin [Pseudoxanthomonas]MDQ1117922.1 hypothetical protein [Pseudoxanthomonas winnipegensis]MDQ1134891.1 hypothetical protein [Pseudoxanthomonas winnipegensis]MDR6138876.1 hypothetical protein [Pseudoxanthomonas sp. SORGH_AS_0997]
MTQKTAAPKMTSVPSRRTGRPVAPVDVRVPTPSILVLSPGDLSPTTLFTPLSTENEVSRKRAHPRRPAQCTVGRRYDDVLVDGSLQSRCVPTLHLSGLWLAELGFAPGSKPRVAIVDGALVITPESGASE